MFSESAALARECGDSRGLVSALAGQGATSWLLGEVVTARVELEGALEANHTLTDAAAPWWKVKILNSLARVLGDAGSEAAGAASARRALDHARRHSLRAASADPLNTLGEHARAKGEWTEAAEYYEEALEIWLERGAKGPASIGLMNMAYIARHRGDAKMAARRLADGLSLQRQTGSTRHLFNSICILAGILLLTRRPLEAARVLGAGQKQQGRVDPADRLEQETDRDALIAALGEDAFEREYAAGQAMTADEALQFADGLLESLLND